VRVTFADSKYKGVVVHDNLDVVSLVEFAVFVDNDEGDIVFPCIMPEVLWDVVEAAVWCSLDISDVMMVEGLAFHGGNMWCLDSFNSCECDLIVLDWMPDEQARQVGMCGDMVVLGFRIGKGVVLAVDGSGVRGLLILQGGDEERSKTVGGDGLRPIVMSRGSVLCIPSHLSWRHFSQYVSV